MRLPIDNDARPEDGRPTVPAPCCERLYGLHWWQQGEGNAERKAVWTIRCFTSLCGFRFNRIADRIGFGFQCVVLRYNHRSELLGTGNGIRFHFANRAFAGSD